MPTADIEGSTKASTDGDHLLQLAHALIKFGPQSAAERLLAMTLAILVTRGISVSDGLRLLVATLVERPQPRRETMN